MTTNTEPKRILIDPFPRICPLCFLPVEREKWRRCFPNRIIKMLSGHPGFGVVLKLGCPHCGGRVERVLCFKWKDNRHHGPLR